MSANPVDHVRDIPYFGITKDLKIVAPQGEGPDGQALWGEGVEILGADASTPMPVYITVQNFSLIFVSLMLVFGAFKAVKGVKARPDEKRGVTAQLFEVLVKFIRDDVAKPNLGPHGSRYYPLILTFFFLILFANLWGMVPAVFTATATSNLNITAGFALIVLFCLFFLGMKEQGVGPFFKSLVPSGLPKVMLPMMYPIEFIGPFTKCFALSIRLFANLMAGHVVLAAFTGLAVHGTHVDYVAVVPAFGLALAMSVLEVFVAFLQAYVFTLLTSVFLGAFIHPDH